MVKLINKMSNHSLLCNSPHRYFHDMAVVYYVLLEVDEEGFLSAQISNPLLDIWNMTETDLCELAYSNTFQLNPIRFSSLKTKLQLMKGVECCRTIYECLRFGVKSNKSEFNDLNTLETVSNTLDKKYYILLIFYT